MIVTTLIWIIVFLICFSYGLIIFKHLEKENFENKLSDNPSSMVNVFFLGFIICYIFANIMSLFVSISLIAFLCVLLPALILFAVNNHAKLLLQVIKSIANSMSLLGLSSVLVLLLFSLWLTSGDIKNSDTYIYHAQSIHWIESYPVIVGLGNFFNRLAYNSGWFVQNALFSFSFLGGRSFHVLNGLLLFLISLFFVLEFSEKSKKKDIGLPQIIGLIIIPLGLITISTQASAPSTDMPVAYIVWYVSYISMRLNKQENLMSDLFLIIGLTAFAFSIKISIAPFFILPACLFLLNRKSIHRKNFLVGLSWLFLILVPWMTRNIIISGYAIYPVGETGLPVEWRIPDDLVKEDAFQIRAFGFYERAPADEVMGKPFLERSKFWFFNLTANQKMMVLFSLFSPFALLSLFIISRVNKKIGITPSFALTIFSFFISFLFWILVSPNFRFGYGFTVFLFTFCVATGIYLCLSFFHISQKVQGLLFSVGNLLIITFLFGKSFTPQELGIRYLYPQDYAQRVTAPCSISEGKETILCASNFGECGYYAFPCHAWGNENVRMYGETMKDGFYLPGD